MEVPDLLRMPGVLPDDPGANRVMVVDDDVNQRMTMLRLLRHVGYDCTAAMSTEEARSLLRREVFGVVVTDHRMWAEDGLELVRFISDRYPNTYSVIVTGFADESLERQAFQSGAFNLMRKPIDRDDFSATVSAAFDHRAQMVAVRRHQSG